MAQYSHLPIYNTAFALLREFYERVPKFSKQYKYLLGERLLAATIEAVHLILEANNTRDPATRAALLTRLIWQAESIIIHLRIANELKQWGGEHAYLHLLPQAVALSKQAEGWKKSVTPMTRPQSHPPARG